MLSFFVSNDLGLVFVAVAKACGKHGRKAVDIIQIITNYFIFIYKFIPNAVPIFSLFISEHPLLSPHLFRYFAIPIIHSLNKI